MKSILLLFCLSLTQIVFAQLYAPGSVQGTITPANTNVGIGTNDPQANLHVSKANTNTSILVENTETTSLAFPGINVNNYGGNSIGHPFLSFNNAKGSKAAPTALSGSLGTLIFSGYNGVNFTQAARIEVLSDALFTSTNSPTYMAFSTTSPGNNIYSEKMRITSSGNVGIGTTSTGTCKLAVEGKIGAREVNVLASGWPDYVFENNYNLPTLSELEAYIKVNKHLPEVPSACTVEENGVNLGEMNMLMLKKIEELTLYVIELKKENEQIKAQINKLK